MNAEGISVFYGATDPDTCLAEIRAPVGSFVLIGRFEPLRKLRILDLTKLKEVFLLGSLFDGEYTESLSRVQFLKRLEEELSQPIIPGAESRDYLPTQVVAEYLGTHPDLNLDGIMFSSSQIATQNSIDDQQSKNIVLFTHACGLFNDEKELKLEVIYHYLNSPNYSITTRKSDTDCLDQLGNTSPPNLAEDGADASVKLDIESIEIRRIEGISYKTRSFNVSWQHSKS
jgi:hypothetical protein